MMNIDLTEEEWEFLQRMVSKVVVLTEMNEDGFSRLKDKDYQKAKRLMEKFIKEKP